MRASDSWIVVVVGYAFMLAWPVSTLALVSFGLRYISSHRQRPSVRLADSAPEHFWIVIPALNEELVVAGTVNAALGLRGPGGTPARVMVIDDGSDDRTPEVLAGLDHPRLHVLRRELPDARKG
jgi:1,2-diacylglycerol 3-beta-glucosyltransferase